MIKLRTKRLAIDVIMLYENMRKTDSTRVIGKQLIHSATSVAANYRAACIARSQREFFSKLSIVVEEADETLFWLEILNETKFVSNELLKPLIGETLELLKIVSKARKSVSSN
ncbi:MAG: four helix bundle protein [Winogradskyella sp.]|nr:four helix bundle protein [Winogradskyella sp.]